MHRYFVLAVLLLLVGTVAARATDCARDRARYLTLIRPLMFHQGMTPADFSRYDAVKTEAVRRLSQFVTAVLLDKLNAGLSPAQLSSYMACVQEGAHPYIPREWMGSDTPVVYGGGETGLPLVSATVLMWGPLGIPEARALVQCFAKLGNQ